ncbi:MAG TPA: DUF2780 domain-containing protein [Vicinamibacterales bacterium]|jgi:hypothetical protein
MPIRTFAVVLTLMLAFAVGASAQAPASSELVSSLAKELGSTPEQAEGAAGALFGLAQSRMKPEEWSKVAASVPGMDGLLKAAPAAAVGTTGAGIPGAGALGGLSSAAGAFSKLGLKPDMVTKAVPVLTSFVTKSGGADVGNLLAAALK